MSLEDLERGGLLLPREEWGQPPDARKGRFALLPIGLGAVCAGWLMSAGDGGALTWAGLGLFLVVLAAFTLVSLLSIR
jgi:hypothetical protein